MPAPKAQIKLSILDKTKRGAGSARASLNKVAGAAGKLTGILSAVGVAGFGTLISKSLEANDALAKNADKIGVSTEALRGFQLAGELAGVSQEKLNKSLQKLNINIGDAQRGTGLAVKSLDALGLSANNLAKLNTEERFLKIASAMEGVTDRTQQAKIATDLFGRAGTDLLVLFDGGADSIRKTVEEAKALGTSLTRVEAAKIEQANDAFTRLRTVGEGFINRVAVQFAPIIEGISTAIKNAAVESGGFQNGITKAFEIGARVVGVFADGFRGIRVIFAGVSVAINGLIQGFAELVLAGAKVRDFLTGSDTAKSFEAFVDAAKVGVSDAKKQFDDLALEPLPSESIKQAIAGYRAISQAAAESTAKIKQAQQNAQPQGVGGDSGANATEQKRIADKFALLQAETKGELELLKFRDELKLAQQIEASQAAFEAGIATDAQHKAVVESLEMQHKERLLQIDRDAAAEKLKIQQDNMASLLSLQDNLANAQEKIDTLTAEQKTKLTKDAFRGALSAAASGSKKLFDLNKSVSIVESILATRTAITNALAVKPFPVGLSLAALAAAKGFAQVKAIKSTQFSGGTAGGTPTGGVASPVSTQNNPVSPEVQAPQSAPKKANIAISGDLNDRETALKFMEQIIQLRDDGFTDFDVSRS